ncbi:MAG: hypothetical protein WC703_05990 [Candidatus Neomarinimicrobiota bacterium]
MTLKPAIKTSLIGLFYLTLIFGQSQVADDRLVNGQPQNAVHIPNSNAIRLRSLVANVVASSIVKF